MLARAETLRVYGAARKSHYECTRNTLQHSTCSLKWWETHEGSIVGVKLNIPALEVPGGGLVVASAGKASIVGSQFDGKQCREQFVPLLSCFPPSMCNYLAFWTPVLLHLLLQLETYIGVDPLVVFSLFMKMDADIIPNFLWAIPSEIISGVLSVH